MAAAKKKPLKMGARSEPITNLKQSILETFDIYGSHIKLQLWLTNHRHLVEQQGSGHNAGKQLF
jgi:hypothetical protein